MVSQSIERIENLIRVVRGIPDAEFDIIRCNRCALGHATRDEYFIAEEFKPNFSTYAGISDFFDISDDRVKQIFYWHTGYESRQQVLASLRVLLLEKMAQEIDIVFAEEFACEEML